MRKLFEIDDIERNRILEMHVDATKNQYLTEQVRISGGIKGEIPSPFSRKKTISRSDVSSKMSKTYNSSSVEEKERVKNTCIKYVNQFGELVTSKLEKSELPLWEEIKKTSPCFAYDVVYAVKNNSWIKSVYLKKNTSKSTEIDTGKPTEDPGKDKPKSPAIRFTTEENYPTADYFEDNSFELSQKGQSDIMAIIQTIKDTKAEFESKGFKDLSICIENLNINSSASRLRNKTAKTFLELSQKRAESMKTFIMEQLSAIRVTTWCNTDNNIVLNFEGENGDGTSGPNPPKPFNFILKGKDVPMNPPMADETKRNEAGEPLTAATKEEVRKLYDKYKYSKLDMTVAFNYVSPGEEGDKKDPDDDTFLPIDDGTVGKKYSAIFFGKLRGKFKFRIGLNLLAWFPRIRIDIKNRGIKANRGKLDCGAYN